MTDDEPPPLRRAKRAKRGGIPTGRIDGGALAGGLAIVLFGFAITVVLPVTESLALVLVGAGLLVGGYVIGRLVDMRPVLHGGLAVVGFLVVAGIVEVAERLVDPDERELTVFATVGADLGVTIGFLVAAFVLVTAGVLLGRNR